MNKYNGLSKVNWFVCGFIWGNCFSRLFGLDIAWGIGGVALLVVITVAATIFFIETRGD